MSAFHDRPDDFLRWLASQPDVSTSGPHSFAPRQTFGTYIRALLNDEIKRSPRDRLELVKDRDGAISRRLFAVGPVTKAAFWEINAVPDIRRQTE